MNKANSRVKRIKIRLTIGLVTALTGCAGTLGVGYYGETVVAPEPDQYLFGGVYYNGHDAYNYSHRGHESRNAAHFRESRGAAHSGASRDAGHSNEDHRGKR